jgi:hypothetical protein
MNAKPKTRMPGGGRKPNPDKAMRGIYYRKPYEVKIGGTYVGSFDNDIDAMKARDEWLKENPRI